MWEERSAKEKLAKISTLIDSASSIEGQVFLIIDLQFIFVFPDPHLVFFVVVSHHLDSIAVKNTPEWIMIMI